MTNEEIIKKAIEKAVKNGYQDEGLYPMKPLLWKIVLESPNILLFNHNFAKAFWGEDSNTVQLNEKGPVVLHSQPTWKYHLQQMVLEEEPLKYLEKFL